MEPCSCPRESFVTSLIVPSEFDTWPVATTFTIPSRRDRLEPREIELVSSSWRDNLGPGDLVVVTELEHQLNFVPWQYIAGGPVRSSR